MTSNYGDGNEFSIACGQIFITDVGTDTRENAFFWLSIGSHVYDHNWNELALQDLEREIDPNDVMNPVILRGHLWKTVQTKFWQVDDGHQLGPMPSQPGLDARFSSTYYGDRRARQTAPWADLSVVRPKRLRQRRRQESERKHDGAETQRCRLPRSKSCEGLRRDEEFSMLDHDRMTRQHSVDRIHFTHRTCQNPGGVDDDEDEIPEAQNAITLIDDGSVQRQPDVMYHMRKCSVGLDSGVDLGSDDEANDGAEGSETWSLEEVSI